MEISFSKLAYHSFALSYIVLIVMKSSPCWVHADDNLDAKSYDYIPCTIWVELQN